MQSREHRIQSDEMMTSAKTSIQFFSEQLRTLLLSHSPFGFRLPRCVCTASISWDKMLQRDCSGHCELDDPVVSLASGGEAQQEGGTAPITSLKWTAVASDPCLVTHTHTLSLSLSRFGHKQLEVRTPIYMLKMSNDSSRSVFLVLSPSRRQPC